MQPDYKNLASGNHQINDGVFSRAIASDDPVLFDVHNLSQEPGAPAYVDFWKRVGMQYVMIVALRAGGNNIGFAILNFNTCERIDTTSTLLKGICVQLAVKVSQILAYEEIERREREKSMLLAFSNAIASERNKNAFAKILKQQLNELFQIQDYVIHALSEDKKYQTPLLFDPDADFANHPDFSKLVGHWTDIRDGVFDVALTSPGPVTINIEQTVVALRLGHEVIGVMKFRHEDQTEFVIQERLFKSICSQIAISAANIIANEKVNQQLNEIKKYKEHLEEEKIYLKEEIESSINNSEIVGESPELKKVFRLIAQVAYSDSTVLLLGETGTGKELVARAIHNSSPHKSKLMVKVNCAAIPPTLIESELFGHERGSFTGAVERRIGKFELANNGTLFLDEIGEMTLEVQVKLLRALQEREIERVGGKAAIKTNVRIITATNRDLEKLLEEGKFRSDLYYRLNTFPITIPPLRNRKDDIPKLAMHFIARYSKKTGKKIEAISHKVIQELIEYDWPGNIRELEHLIERSVLMVTGDSINEVHLPHQKRNTALSHDKEDNIIKSLKENEKDHILKVLRHVKGRIGGKGGAAEILGLPTSTLNSRIKKLGIRREHL
jgi:transcriptional regulator with GAF, ATPase, and Fis domain